jgi:hypothetical protein
MARLAAALVAGLREEVARLETLVSLTEGASRDDA